ncbi:hypothetical protein [Corynebacterium sanguinis]
MNHNNRPRPAVKTKIVADGRFVAWSNVHVRRGETLNHNPLVDLEIPTAEMTLRLSIQQAFHLAERLTSTARQQQANYQKGNR